MPKLMVFETPGDTGKSPFTAQCDPCLEELGILLAAWPQMCPMQRGEHKMVPMRGKAKICTKTALGRL